MDENILNEEMKKLILERKKIEKMMTKNQYNRIRQYELTHNVTLSTDEILKRFIPKQCL